MKQSEFRVALDSTWKWMLRGLNPFYNFWLKFLSIITALLALYFIAGQAIIEEIEVPLYLTPPPDLASAKPIENRTIVQVLASSTMLNSVDKKQIYFDFKKIDFKEGETFINLENYIKTPPGIEVSKITPSKLHIIFEKKVIKEVPIAVHIQGKTPKGYEFVKYEINPPKVQIEGAKSVLKNISFLETDTISLTNRIETFATDAPLRTENLNITINANEPIVITTYIIKNPKTYIIKKVPVYAESQPKKCVFNPKTVSIVIVCKENITKPAPGDLYVSFDLSDIPCFDKEFRAVLKAEIKDSPFADNCYIKSLSQKKVTVIVRGAGD